MAWNGREEGGVGSEEERNVVKSMTLQKIQRFFFFFCEQKTHTKGGVATGECEKECVSEITRVTHLIVKKKNVWFT